MVQEGLEEPTGDPGIESEEKVSDGGTGLHCGGDVESLLLLLQETESWVLKAPALSDLVRHDVPADQSLPVLHNSLVSISPAPCPVSKPQTRS